MYKLFIRNQLQLSMGIYWWEDVLFLNFGLPRFWLRVQSQ